MHVRVTTMSYELAQEEKVFQIIDDKLIPQLRKLQGFISYTGGVDRDTERCVYNRNFNNDAHTINSRGSKKAP